MGDNGSLLLLPRKPTSCGTSIDDSQRRCDAVAVVNAATARLLQVSPSPAPYRFHIFHRHSNYN
jgi:hypothetical protein